MELFRHLQARVWVDALKPAPIVSEKFRGDHMNHKLGHCMGQWFPVKPGAWKTESSHGVQQGSASPTAPAREEDRLDVGGRARPRFQLSKPIVMSF